MPDFMGGLTTPFLAAFDPDGRKTDQMTGKGNAGGGRASFKCDQCDWSSGDPDEADQHEEETGHSVFGAAALDKGVVGRGTQQ